jgi:putative DNA methylase
MTSNNNLKGWYSRGYLPHFDLGCVPQGITFRLADSLPFAKYKALCDQLEKMSKARADEEKFLGVDNLLDAGFGASHLAKPNIAAMVESALLFFDGSRYQLHAWAIMPNHVHVLLTPKPDESLPGILHSLKSFTANRANKLIGSSGAFWQREYFDRLVKDETQYYATIEYIENNPVKAGLCSHSIDWKFSSARARLNGKFTL